MIENAEYTRRTAKWPLVFALLLLSIGAARGEDLSAIATLNAFYDALREDDCDRAAALRPGYSLERCLKITETRLSLSEVKNPGRYYDGENYAVIHMSVDYQQKDQNEAKNFTGFVSLKKQNGKWIIGTGTYNSHLAFEDYIGWVSKKPGFEDLPRHSPSIAKPAVTADEPPQPSAAADTENGAGANSADSAAKDATGSSIGGNFALYGMRPKRRPTEEAGGTEPSTAVPERWRTRAVARMTPIPVSYPPRGGQNMWQNNGPVSFGSRRILESCWSPQELAGRPGEKKIRRKGANIYRKAPERPKPKQKLGSLPKRFHKSIRRVDTGEQRLVALTFDTCERNNEVTGYDAEIVDYLRRNGIRATFYLGGKWMATHPERALQLIVDPLFEIGNHGWTHGNMRVLRGKDAEDQVFYTQAQYELLLEDLHGRRCAVEAGASELAKIPAQPPTFRYPYGTCSAETLKAVNQAGLPAIQWDVVTGDPAPRQSAEAIARIVLKNTRPGSIVIMHSNGRGWKTGKALPLFIPKLREKGYRFVTVSELLRAGKPKTVNMCYELNPGDNKKYDKLFGRGTGD